MDELACGCVKNLYLVSQCRKERNAKRESLIYLNREEIFWVYLEFEFCQRYF